MAIRRSRGLRSLTTLPPMRISPEVGSSSPAIIRSRVVLPDPEGPRRTRNSPSLVSRSTLTTAPTFPRLKTLVSFRVSTTAMNRSPSLPLVEDATQLRVGGFDRRLRRHLIASRFGEHGGQDKRVEGLVDRCGGVAGISDVGGPVQHVAQHLVLLRRHPLRIVADALREVRH